VQPAPVHPDAEPNPDGPVPVAPAGAVVPASRPVRFTLPPRISLQFHNALREVLSGDMLAGLRGSTGNLLQEEQALALTLQRSHDERGGVRLVRPVGGEAGPQFFLHPLAWERSVALCFGLATPPQPLQDDPDQTHAVKRPRQEDDDCKEEPIDESAFAGSSSSAFGGSSSGTRPRPRRRGSLGTHTLSLMMRSTNASGMKSMAALTLQPTPRRRRCSRSAGCEGRGPGREPFGCSWDRAGCVFSFDGGRVCAPARPYPARGAARARRSARGAARARRSPPAPIRPVVQQERAVFSNRPPSICFPIPLAPDLCLPPLRAPLALFILSFYCLYTPRRLSCHWMTRSTSLMRSCAR